MRCLSQAELNIVSGGAYDTVELKEAHFMGMFAGALWTGGYSVLGAAIGVFMGLNEGQVPLTAICYGALAGGAFGTIAIGAGAVIDLHWLTKEATSV
jgi:hypothetical protein